MNFMSINPGNEPKTQLRQLADYIKKNISKGYTLETLKYSLLSQGYGRTSIGRAVDLANKELAQTVPKMKEKPEITRKVYVNDEVISQTGSLLAQQKSSGFFQKLIDFFR